MKRYCSPMVARRAIAGVLWHGQPALGEGGDHIRLKVVEIQVRRLGG